MPRKRTAAQRAALRKAQIASARKRRRRRNLAIGAIGVATGVGIAIGANHVGKRYAKHLTSRPKPGRNKPMLALPPGKSAAPTRARERRRAQKAAKIARAKTGAKNVIPSHKGVFKFSAKGKGQYVRRHRPDYDAARRAAHVSKPRTKYGPRRK